eukprot:6170837-Prymnesium_polylepis.1
MGTAPARSRGHCPLRHRSHACTALMPRSRLVLWRLFAACRPRRCALSKMHRCQGRSQARGAARLPSLRHHAPLWEASISSSPARTLASRRTSSSAPGSRTWMRRRRGMWWARPDLTRSRRAMSTSCAAVDAVRTKRCDALRGGWGGRQNLSRGQ